MVESLNNDDISTALDELIACLGIKEEVPSHDLVALLKKNDTEGCVQEIATRLGLPICINLSYIPTDFSPGNPKRFRSSTLVRTNWTGRGTEAITAQVSIPPSLPIFGTSGLQGYPIHVRVSENCHAHPDTFVAIMAHELSHVLLACLWSKHKDSELHTDLVPIILGFRKVVGRGRTTVETTRTDSSIITQTTAYGYLTDSQFRFACSHVTGLLLRHLHDRNRLLKAVAQVQKKLTTATRNLATFRDYFRHLDSHPPERMRREHAERLVQLHGQDHTLEWESRITAARKSMEAAEAFARPLNYYPTSAVERLKAHMPGIQRTSEKLDHVTEAISKDMRVLRRYVGFVYRLRRRLWRHS